MIYIFFEKSEYKVHINELSLNDHNTKKEIISFDTNILYLHSIKSIT